MGNKKLPEVPDHKAVTKTAKANKDKAPPDLSWIAEQLRPLAVPIDSIDFDPANAMKHGDENLTAIRASLRVYGMRKPIVVNRKTGTVEAGNGTLSAALALGKTHIAVVYVDDCPTVAAGYAISDNRTSQLGEFDKEALDALLRTVQTDDQELADMMTALAEEMKIVPALTPAATPEAPEPQIDRAAELQKKWGTEAGQLWLVESKTTPGRFHKLLCGDSTRAEDVERVMGGEKADIALTSPPYNTLPQKNAPSGLHGERKSGVNKWIAKAVGSYQDAMPENEYQAWLSAVVEECLRLCKGLVWINHKVRYRDKEAVHPVRFLDFPLYAEVVWNRRGSMALNCKRFAPSHEGLWAFGLAHYWDDEQNKLLSVWDIPFDREDNPHPCSFPVEIAKRPIVSSCPVAGIVLDPFAGAGTTLVAAEQNARIAFGMELSPAYTACTLERLEQMSLSPRLAEPDKAAA